MARTRSQAALMADSHQELQRENNELRKEMEALRGEMKQMKEDLTRTLSNLETFRAEAKIKEYPCPHSDRSSARRTSSSSG
jgi:predicted nuclease with TOPRIM domain